MALPAFRALGTFASGTTSCTPGLPAGHTTDDILVLIVECDDSETPNTPSGYTSLGSANDGADVKLTVFIKRDNGSESAPTVDGTTNHIHAWIGAYSGVQNTGSPWLLGSFTSQQTATVTYAGITTGFNDALVLLLTAIGDNANDTENLSGYTNANLSSLTDRDDEAETTGTGGGLGFADGGKASAGATGDSTCTHDNAVGSVSVHLALYSSTSSSTTLTADAGSYSITGTAADAGDIIMPADSGSYSISGTAATTFKSIILAAVAGTYAIAGNDIGFGEFAQWMPMSVSEVDTSFDSASPFMPVCATQGDYQLFIVETDDVAVTLTTANGFSEHPGSPVSVPNADSTIRTRLTVFERIFNGTDGAPIVDATGSDHIIGRSLTFRARLDRNLGWLDLAAARSAVSGTGWAVVSEATEDTSGSWGSVITDTPDQLIIGIVAAAKPSSGNTNLSAITNANLTNIIERVDFARVGGAIGNGGGLGVFTGEFAETGERPDPQPDVPIGTTTFTWGTPAYKATLLIALRPGSRDATPHLKANCEGANGGSTFFSLYFISGGPATLRVGFPVDSGVYGVTGSDATLIPPAGGATLTADPGAYAVAGTVADFDIALLITSGEGAIGEYTYAGASGGNEVTFHDPNRLPGGAESGTYTYAGAGGPDETVLDGPDGDGGAPDNRTWLGQDGDARHWRFFGRYRRGRRTGTIH